MQTLKLKIFISFVLFILVQFTFGQEKSKKHLTEETTNNKIGLLYQSSSGTLKFLFKNKVETDKYLRLNAALGALQIVNRNDNILPDQLAFRSGLGIGLEKQRRLSNHFSFHNGPQIEARITIGASSTSFVSSFRFDASYFAGLKYHINKRSNIFVEVQPTIEIGTLASRRRVYNMQLKNHINIGISSAIS